MPPPENPFSIGDDGVRPRELPQRRRDGHARRMRHRRRRRRRRQGTTTGGGWMRRRGTTTGGGSTATTMAMMAAMEGSAARVDIDATINQVSVRALSGRGASREEGGARRASSSRRPLSDIVVVARRLSCYSAQRWTSGWPLLRRTRDRPHRYGTATQRCPPRCCKEWAGRRAEREEALVEATDTTINRVRTWASQIDTIINRLRRAERRSSR